MTKTKKMLCLLLPFLWLSSCYKDQDDSLPPEVVLETTPVWVNTTLHGHLLDLEGHLVSNYTLLINSEAFDVTHDYFSFQVEEVNKKGQLIYAVKDGKTIAISTFLPIENDINRVELTAFPSWTRHNINGNHTFAISNDWTIDFSGTSFLDAQGATFSSPAFIESGVFSQQNQPTIFGYNAKGYLTALSVMGGFYLNFEKENGETLSIADTYSLDINIANLSEKSNTLYRLDEAQEAWIEVGKADKKTIQTQVSSSGYFIIAKAVKGIFVAGKSSKENFPVAYQKYIWNKEDMKGSHIGTESGRWLTVLAQATNIPFTLVNPCGEEIQTENILTNHEDIENKAININSGHENYQFLSTKIVNCDGEIETAQNIHLKIGHSQSYIYTFGNDDIKAWLPVCSPFTMTAYDIETNTEGPNLEWSTDITDEFSFLSNCPDYNNGFTYLKIRGETKIFPPFILENDGEQSFLHAEDNTVRFSVAGTETGDFTDNQVNIYINAPNFGTKGYYISCENSALGCGMEDCFISHYNLNPDGSVRISFSGTLWMRTIDPVVAGYFDVEGIIFIKN